MSNTLKSILIVLFILVIDQVVKILVKTNMTLYEQFPVFGDWFRIHFVENRGMAFGLNLPGEYGKILLSLFRIIAVVAITFYLRHLIRLNAHTGLIITLSMIMAGALGNILDSAFYGLIFTESTPSQVAQMFPEGKGYTTFLHGNVVDMFYLPVFSGTYPEWFPRVGGESFIFFRPVFNIADASISVAVFVLLFNQRRFFRHLDEKHGDQKEEEQSKPGAEPGGEHGMEHGSEPETEHGADRGKEHETKHGTKHKTKHGTEHETEHGPVQRTGPGPDPGMDQGTDPGTGYRKGSDPGLAGDSEANTESKGGQDIKPDPKPGSKSGSGPRNDEAS